MGIKNLSQCERIFLAMVMDSKKEKWYAKDFQTGLYFVGYEASARMSDLVRMYPDLLIVGQDGRFRTLSLNWKEKGQEITDIAKILISKTEV